MNVSCLQENLNKALGIVGRAVAARSTLPVTSHVLLSTEGGRLKLSATNLEIAVSCWIGAQVEEEGAITTPARLFIDLISSLPNERVDLTLPARSRQLKLVCARNEATIGGMAADDFPPIPEVEGGVSIKLDPQTLHRALRQVVFAAATDDSRPVLAGVDIVLEEDQLTLAAADGFRLAVYHLPLKEKVSERTEIIIPARALGEIDRLLAENLEDLLSKVDLAELLDEEDILNHLKLPTTGCETRT